MSRLLRNSRLQLKSSLAWCSTLATSKGARGREGSVLYVSSAQSTKKASLRSPCLYATRGVVDACSCSVSRTYSTTVKEPQSDESKVALNEEGSSNLDIVEDLLTNVQVEVEKTEDEAVAPKRSTPLSIEECVAILREENARDVFAIELGSKTAQKYATYLVTCSGTSTRHLRAMTHRLKTEAKGVQLDHIDRVVVEGWRCKDWMVVDMGNIVVHLMLEDRRQTLELEKLWSLGAKFDDQMRALTQEPEDSAELYQVAIHLVKRSYGSVLSQLLA